MPTNFFSHLATNVLSEVTMAVNKVEHLPIALRKRDDGSWEAEGHIMGHFVSATGSSAYEADQALQALVQKRGYWTQAWT